MKCVSVVQLSDATLTRELAESVARDCRHTARQVALIAEFGRRKLYLPAGYNSMFAYCVGELRLSEDAAYKRIQVASAARRCPSVLVALSEGRVHLSGLNLLAAHLNAENVEELLSVATHKSKRDIERVVAERFPKPDLPALVRPIASPPPLEVEPPTSASPGEHPEHAQVIEGPEMQPAPGQVVDLMSLDRAAPHAVPTPTVDRARVAPLAPQRYGIQFTLDQTAYELLRHVQDLLGHQVLRSDLTEVFVRALKAYASQLERQRFAATENPRPARRPRPGSRHIPAYVKRAVRERDSERCTFVSESGKRCEARSGLEFDHVLEYARGGEATVSGIRLRCRAHNQYTAERTYGEAFMQHKRSS